MIHHQDDWLTIHGGDNRDVMRTLPAESVQCVVSSPPYWGLRDYGTASWDGGDPECDHKAAKKKTRYDYALDSSPIQQASRTGTDAQVGSYLPMCPTCGAIRQDQQLGLESTPEAYVAAMVDVFREVRRVMRPDATLWLNLGDSYAANGGTDRPAPTNTGNVGAGNSVRRSNGPIGLKPKDLVGIPWRVAFALQADGWYLRSDIIWSKPNPMPESVTDRPTKAHEYLFLLSKSERYHYDADAIREPSIYAGTVVKASNPDTAKNGQKGQYGATALGFTQHDTIVADGRNRRSVWTIATKPYPGAHFATFPEALVEPCILAGAPEGSVVLDPFAGTGTVGVVAERLSRRAVLIDLNPSYLEQCLERNRQRGLGLSA